MTDSRTPSQGMYLASVYESLSRQSLTNSDMLVAPQSCRRDCATRRGLTTRLAARRRMDTNTIFESSPTGRTRARPTILPTAGADPNSPTSEGSRSESPVRHRVEKTRRLWLRAHGDEARSEDAESLGGRPSPTSKESRPCGRRTSRDPEALLCQTVYQVDLRGLWERRLRQKKKIEKSSNRHLRESCPLSGGLIRKTYGNDRRLGKKYGGGGGGGNSTMVSKLADFQVTRLGPAWMSAASSPGRYRDR